MGWKLLGINAHPIFLGSKSQIQKGKMGKKQKSKLYERYLGAS